MEINQDMLKELIRRVIEEELGSVSNNSFKQMDPSGIGVIRPDKMTKKDRMDTGNDKDQVYVTDIFSIDESPRLGAGIMEMTESTFDWTLNYDEVDYIIEGTLEIIIDGRKVIGNKGDIILIPKNSTIKFSVPNYAKFLYVVYPANWQDQK